MIPAFLTFAHLYWNRNDKEAAYAILQDARDHLVRLELKDRIPLVDAYEASLRIREDHKKYVRKWAAGSPIRILRLLGARGLQGVQLVISDAHLALRQAIKTVLVGASWHRCRVHFMRTLLTYVPKAAQPMVAALIRTIFLHAAG